MINVTDKSQCCGCNACGDACPKDAITFKTDHEGFWYPEVNQDLCINCGLCEKACPVINVDKLKKNDFEMPRCYAAMHKNNDVRFESTSGGLFSAFAEKMYRDQGYVGGAVVDTEKGGVKHFISADKEDLAKLRKSKYEQSRLNGFYRQVRDLLKAGEKVLVCGSPCQMAALRSFLNYKDYENLIILDFVCRGTNSPLVSKKYSEYLERRYGSKLIYANAKNKELGWHTMAVKHKFENGKYVYIPADRNWFSRGYLKTGVFCRPSCYECKFKGFPRIADITLADFWGIEKLNKEMDDNVGTSLVLINSKKGEKFFEAISQKIKSQEFTPEQAYAKNPSLLTPLDPPKIDRESFFKDLNSMNFEDCAEKHFPFPKGLPWKRKFMRFWRIIKKAMKATPWYALRPKLQFFYYNFLCKEVKASVWNAQYILPHTDVVIDFHKGAKVEINAPLVLGFKYVKGSHLETRLKVDNGGTLRVDSQICFGYGSDVQVRPGALLHAVDNGIGRDSGANRNLTLVCGEHIEIGQDVRMGSNVTIRDNNGDHVMSIQGYKNSRPVKIGQHAWLCEGCTIMSGVKIGDGGIVGAHAVVYNSVKPFTMVAGNPAQLVHEDVHWKF